MTFDEAQDIVLGNAYGDYKGERSRLRRAIEVIAEAVDCTHEEVMEAAHIVCICGQCAYDGEDE